MAFPIVEMDGEGKACRDDGMNPGSGMESVCRQLQHSLKRVQELVDSAEERLAPILRDDVPLEERTKSEEGGKAPPRCRLAGTLLSDLIALDSACDRFTDILNRCDL